MDCSDGSNCSKVGVSFPTRGDRTNISWIWNSTVGAHFPRSHEGLKSGVQMLKPKPWRLSPVKGTSIVAAVLSLVALVFEDGLEVEQDARARLHFVQRAARHGPHQPEARQLAALVAVHVEEVNHQSPALHQLVIAYLDTKDQTHSFVACAFQMRGFRNFMGRGLDKIGKFKTGELGPNAIFTTRILLVTIPWSVPNLETGPSNRCNNQNFVRVCVGGGKEMKPTSYLTVSLRFY